MINRVLIRIKVVQMLYSFAMSQGAKSLTQAESDLQKSLDKSYELYVDLLKLMIDLTDLEDRKLDDAKHKFLPTEEDLNPNTRFVDNSIVAELRANEEIQAFLKDNPCDWKDNELFLSLMLDKIKHSEDYKMYMELDLTDNQSDSMLWRNLMKHVILTDDDLLEEIQAHSVYLNDDDLNIMGQFVLKTIRRVENAEEQILLPKYKDQEDSEFGAQLFSRSIRDKADNDKLIDSFIKSERWDSERIALMDRIIMNAAITEALNFVKIPANVTLNEYIEIAKNYSTPKDAQFVNGILNAVFKNLKEQGKLNK